MRLATSIDRYDIEYADRIIPLVDLVELTPDRWAKKQPGSGGIEIPGVHIDFLHDIAKRVPVSLHGVGLSIGSSDGWSTSYISILDQLFPVILPIWHSEHLGFSSVDGETLGTMVEMPRTEEALDLVCERVLQIQSRFDRPFLLEHVARAFPDDGEECCSAARFMNQIVSRTDCGILLDVYNLECDRHNIGFDIESFLGELNLDAVREIHVAGGTIQDGFRLDIHSRFVADSTFALAVDVIDRCRSAEAVVFELLGESVNALGIDGIENELRRLRRGLSLE